jgi:hypothetical protein
VWRGADREPRGHAALLSALRHGEIIEERSHFVKSKNCAEIGGRRQAGCTYQSFLSLWEMHGLSLIHFERLSP